MFVGYACCLLVMLIIVRAPNSVYQLFGLVPWSEATKVSRVEPRVDNHDENEYCRADVRRWGVSEI